LHKKHRLAPTAFGQPGNTARPPCLIDGQWIRYGGARSGPGTHRLRGTGAGPGTYVDGCPWYPVWYMDGWYPSLFRYTRLPAGFL